MTSTNITSYLNITISLLTNTENSITDRIKIITKQLAMVDLINMQFTIELSVAQGRSLDDKKRLQNIQSLFNDCKNIITSISANINTLQQYINEIYNVDSKTNITQNILSRDDLFNKTNLQINNFITFNTISLNDTANITMLKKIINDSLNKIQLQFSYYDIKKLIEINIAQIIDYDSQINSNPPPQNLNSLQLLRTNLYNKTNNMINIEITNRSDTDLTKEKFNLYHTKLMTLSSS